MSACRDDLPAQLVRAAARQLGDRDLAARWGEEWLFSLPPRDRYRRWRYALSLLVRGAHATRLEIRHPATGSNWYRCPAPLRRALCVLLTGCTMLIFTSPFQTGWPLPTALDAVGWYEFSICCVLVLTLMAESVYHRIARWVLVTGLLVGLGENWTGTWFLPIITPRPPTPGPSLPTAWNLTLDAIFLAAVSGGLVIAAAYRTLALTRIGAALAASILLLQTAMCYAPPWTYGGAWPALSGGFNHLPGIEIFWDHACYYLAGLPPTGEAGYLPMTFYYSIWGLQFLILAGVAAVVVRAGSAVVCALRVSARHRAPDRPAVQ